MRGGARITSLGGAPGLTFVRADRDGDGNFTPLTSTSWDGDAYGAGTGTINWNSVFGVPTEAKAVLLEVTIKDATVGAVIAFMAKSTTAHFAFVIKVQISNDHNSLQGTVAIASDGTSYYYIEVDLDYVAIRVVGWYI